MLIINIVYSKIIEIELNLYNNDFNMIRYIS